MNNNKNILAIETSSNVCGISYIEKGSCVGCVEEDISKKHAELLPEFYLNLQKNTDFILKIPLARKKVPNGSKRPPARSKFSL